MGIEFQHMRQKHQIQATASEWQFIHIQPYLHPGLVPHYDAQRHTAGTQKIMLGQPELQGIEAKNISHTVIKQCLLAPHQIFSWRRGEPIIQRICS